MNQLVEHGWPEYDEFEPLNSKKILRRAEGVYLAAFGVSHADAATSFLDDQLPYRDDLRQTADNSIAAVTEEVLSRARPNIAPPPPYTLVQLEVSSGTLEGFTPSDRADQKALHAALSASRIDSSVIDDLVNAAASIPWQRHDLRALTAAVDAKAALTHHTATLSEDVDAAAIRIAAIDAQREAVSKVIERARDDGDVQKLELSLNEAVELDAEAVAVGGLGAAAVEKCITSVFEREHAVAAAHRATARELSRVAGAKGALQAQLESDTHRVADAQAALVMENRTALVGFATSCDSSDERLRALASEQQDIGAAMRDCIATFRSLEARAKELAGRHAGLVSERVNVINAEYERRSTFERKMDSLRTHATRLQETRRSLDRQTAFLAVTAKAVDATAETAAGDTARLRSELRRRHIAAVRSVAERFRRAYESVMSTAAHHAAAAAAAATAATNASRLRDVSAESYRPAAADAAAEAAEKAAAAEARRETVRGLHRKAEELDESYFQPACALLVRFGERPPAHPAAAACADELDRRDAVLDQRAHVAAGIVPGAALAAELRVIESQALSLESALAVDRAHRAAARAAGVFDPPGPMVAIDDETLMESRTVAAAGLDPAVPARTTVGPAPVLLPPAVEPGAVADAVHPNAVRLGGETAVADHRIAGDSVGAGGCAPALPSQLAQLAIGLLRSTTRAQPVPSAASGGSTAAPTGPPHSPTNSSGDAVASASAPPPTPTPAAAPLRGPFPGSYVPAPFGVMRAVAVPVLALLTRTLAVPLPEQTPPVRLARAAGPDVPPKAGHFPHTAVAGVTRGPYAVVGAAADGAAAAVAVNAVTRVEGVSPGTSSHPANSTAGLPAGGPTASGPGGDATDDAPPFVAPAIVAAAVAGTGIADGDPGVVAIRGNASAADPAVDEAAVGTDKPSQAAIDASTRSALAAAAISSLRAGGGLGAPLGGSYEHLYRADTVDVLIRDYNGTNEATSGATAAADKLPYLHTVAHVAGGLRPAADVGIAGRVGAMGGAQLRKEPRRVSDIPPSRSIVDTVMS